MMHCDPWLTALKHPGNEALRATVEVCVCPVGACGGCACPAAAGLICFADKLMPTQDSLPLLIGCLAAAAVCAWLWKMGGQVIWLGLASVAIVVGIAAATVDHLTITDREELELLLPRLARAVQEKDLSTLLAAIAPEVRPVRRQAEDAVKRIRPSQVVITKLEVEVDVETEPLTAAAELLVRVSGQVADQHEGTGIVAATVSLEKRDRWLVTDCVVRPAEPLGGRR